MTQEEVPARSSQWLFTQEEVRRSPSSSSGYTYERERTERMKGCDFILKVGMKLRLPQTTISTACVFLHRFYMRFPLKDYHYYEIAATTIFLATKCEETGRKLSDIVVACAKTAQKNDAALIDEQSKDYWRWRDVILYNEELLLEALCFDLIIEHPYSLLKDYWRQYQGGREVAKTAWACANDTYRTTIHLCYDTPSIAVACLYYASIFSGQILEDVNNKPWYEDTSVNMNIVVEIITIMVELYENSQQIVKDGYDPKALAVAGTEALRLLQEQLASIKAVPLTEISQKDAQCLVIEYSPSTTTQTKRPNAGDSNGHAKKRLRADSVELQHDTNEPRSKVKDRTEVSNGAGE